MRYLGFILSFFTKPLAIAGVSAVLALGAGWGVNNIWNGYKNANIEKESLELQLEIQQKSYLADLDRKNLQIAAKDAKIERDRITLENAAHNETALRREAETRRNREKLFRREIDSLKANNAKYRDILNSKLPGTLLP